MASYSGDNGPDIAEDFGQRVDLTRRIREILTNYPEGTTVLKEIIQNADDAGATEVYFCLDRRKHGEDSLLYKELSSWQGPALLAYNNAQFTDDDFESISKLGGSRKQGQPWKTGRFGVGFNSVYHLSDLPSFVSGRYIVFFDPQCKFLPKVSAVNPGKRIDFVRAAALSHYKDQFQPYCGFGCDMETVFKGTLFRFPLRTAVQALESQLSRQHYSEADIMHLFSELYEEATLCMLFLKNVEVIKFYEWHLGSRDPDVLFECSLNSPSADIRWHRCALTRLSTSWTSQLRSGSVMAKQLDSFTLNFDTKRYAVNLETKTESFLIVQCLETLTSKIGAMASFVADKHGVYLLPWAAVAAKIVVDTKEVSEQSSNTGKAFCFLPLPLKTNLPVHVNGFFELSSNRRDIWHGGDMEGMGRIRSDWNTLLLNDVVTSAYCQLLIVAPEVNRLHYSFWPSGSYVEPWKGMVAELFKIASQCHSLHSNIDGGRWIALSQAVVHDEHMPNCDRQASTLTALGFPLVRLPKALLETFSFYCDFTMVCPNLVRQHLRRSGSHVFQIERDMGLDLLEYCLSDVVDEEASADLCGLPLVPLANGGFGMFEAKSSVLSYFIGVEQQYYLMEKVNDRMIDRLIPKTLFQRLSQIAESSSANIRFLSVIDFFEFLNDILPVDWKGRDVVKWMPSHNQDHPGEEWIIMLWQYLKGSCADLSPFDTWPLLPTKNGFLCKARRSLGIVKGDESLPQSLESILVGVGCQIMKSNLPIDHPWLLQCVQSPTAKGVLEAISCTHLRTGSTYTDMLLSISFEQKIELRSFLLDVKWYTENQMTDYHLRVLKSLPIFEVCGCKEPFVDLLTVKKYLPPFGVDESLLGTDFLHPRTQQEVEVLTRALSIQQIDRATFFRWRVIDRMEDLSSDVRDEAMLTILKDLPLLCLQDSALKDALMNLSFVPTQNGQLQCSKDLYDPRMEDLQVLLNGDDSFPSHAFRSNEVLDALQLLGLQTVVSSDTLLASARQIEALMRQMPDEANARGLFLLSYLEVNSAKLFPMTTTYDGRNSMFSKVSNIFHGQRSETIISKKFWNELASICWCPVLVRPPHLGLPWPSVTTLLAPPKLVRLPSDLWLASASMRILNGECQSALLSQKLGWTSRLGSNVVAAQLLELGRGHAAADSQELKQALATVIPKMYALLTEKVGTEELEIVKTVLEGSQWVWVGDRFVTAHEAVLSGPLHLAPYLWVIPADLAVFKELLLELGVKETFVPQDFAMVLSKMASLKGPVPLDLLELKTAIWILQHLADLGFGGGGEPLPVPDVRGVLVSSSLLTYNDAPWLLGDSQAGGASLDVPVGGRSLPSFVHANISNDVAERLGIKSLRRLLLAESADSLNMTLHGAAEAFGQHEALTTRLKHIVDMYADGPGILCELLQNSDDAEASEVSFVLDWSQYGSSSLLSPKMSDWQGPALYCFNNSVFTSKDLHAISRIGQDSKLEKPHAVGRFGLGFNSVYHFTDVPSFVSGNNFVIFDPHACHLPGISPSHPGLKVNFAGKGIALQFPDQCRPYMLFGCDLQHSFNGTLFRFPLRNSTTATRSQIKQAAYDPGMVLSLFENFRAIASEVLLFLHNVKCITVNVREGLDQDMHLLYRVEKHSSQKKSVYNFLRNMKAQAQGKDDFYKWLRDLPGECLPRDCELVSIRTEEIGKRSTEIWMASEYLGGKQAVAMAASPDNRTHGFVPWAGVAAKLGVEAEANRSTSSIEEQPKVSELLSAALEGRAFCFLPLPVKTGLPVHVNAYFELSSNRRDIWYGDDMAGGGKARSEWNLCLLKEVTPPAYVWLLAGAACQLGPSDEYHSLWPTGTLSEPWTFLSCGVYVSAAELDVPVLFTNARGGQWVPAKKAVFPDHSYPRAMELGETLADAGLALVKAPESVVSQFQKHCPWLRYLTPRILRLSLLKRNKPLSSRAAMLAALRYSLHDITKAESATKLDGLPLIPLANGVFRAFTCSHTEEKVFVANEVEYSLLKGTLLDRLVDRTIDMELFGELQAIAELQTTNLAALSPTLFRELLPGVLPLEWFGKHLVTWTPGELGHPTIAWMELFWRYLSAQSADLSLFSKWPLLPTSDGHHLLQLTKGSCMLVGDNWSENMVSLLQKANCFLLSSSFTIDHPLRGEYVRDGTASGLLGALLAAAGGFKGLSEALQGISDLEMQELRGFLFQKKWFDGHMGAVQVEILKHLPIFKSYRKSGHVNLVSSTRFFPPNGVAAELLGDDFIYAESEKEETILSNRLGVKRLGKEAFYESYAFKNLENAPASMQSKVILSLLKDFSSLEKEAPTIRRVLSHLPVIPTKHGMRKSPKELYDPRIQELHSLVDERFFPSLEFSDDGVLDILIQLGLKTTLGLKDLLESATCVASVCSTDEQRALRMGKCLLAHIDRLGIELEVTASEDMIIHDPAFLPRISATVNTENDAEEQEFGFEDEKALGEADGSKEDMQLWHELTGISWCPVLIDAPDKDLPWPKGLTSSLVPPKIVRLPSQMWHVSATMRILDGDVRSKTITSRLGWLEKPSLSILAMQLIELSQQHNKIQVESSLEVMTEEREARVTRFNEVLNRVVPALYDLIEEFLKQGDISSLQSMLEGNPWVWVEDGFVLAKEAAFVTPSHFWPYLHVVPAKVSHNRVLLSALGVREAFDLMDYVHVLQRVSTDMRGKALGKELLDFVFRVLEAIDDLMQSGSVISNSNFLGAILVPDADGILRPAKDLVYNDAPWLAKGIPGVAEMKSLIHPDIRNELADRIGVKSLRYLSFVDKEMTRDLPCLSSEDIFSVLASYGEGPSLLLDLLEIADKCKARRVHVLYDKRSYGQTSILQPNLGPFQGAALTVVFEGADMTAEDICNLQLSPSWSRRGQNKSYGAGLLSCYSITDLLLLVSKGCLYLFDPSGVIVAPSIATGNVPAAKSPQGKVYTFQGTDIPQKFADQFLPFAINREFSWVTKNTTILRMPLYAYVTSALGFRRESSEAVLNRILENFIAHAPTSLLFLNSVEAVHLSAWEPDRSSSQESFSVKVDPACAALRNTFFGRNSKKFQLSTIFNSSSNMTKMNTIDVFINQDGNCIMDKWVVVSSFGCGSTKALALDRRFLSYDLSPIAGVAAHVSRIGSLPSCPIRSTFLCPLPLSFDCMLPVTIFGCFIVSHEGFRHVFPSSPPADRASTAKHTASLTSQPSSMPTSLVWNQELMACVRESYIQLLSELMSARQDTPLKNPSHGSSDIHRGTWKSLGEQSYALWPLSQKLRSNVVAQEQYSSRGEREWLVELLIKPVFVRLADLPVWKLHGGSLAKATEGMFLSNPTTDQKDLLPPEAVCEFLKAHYKVFAVPCELTRELQEARVSIKVITPRMVRYLLCALSVAPRFSTVGRYIELLEYSCADFEAVSLEKQAKDDSSSDSLESHATVGYNGSDLRIYPGDEMALLQNRNLSELQGKGGDSLDLVTNIRRAFLQFGKVVEDLSTEAGQKLMSQKPLSDLASGSTSESEFEKWINELKGLPCPMATLEIVRLGRTQSWLGNHEQQKLLMPLASRFIHTSCLEKPLLSKVLHNQSVQQALQIKPLTSQLLSDNLSYVLPKQWGRSLTSVPWVAWDYERESRLRSPPTSEWLRTLWVNIDVSKDGLLSFHRWPLLPAVLGSTVLVKVEYADLLFIPPIVHPTMESSSVGHLEGANQGQSSQDTTSALHTAFAEVQERHPWLFHFLQQCKIPIFDQNFLDCRVVDVWLPLPRQSLGQVIWSKMLAASQHGYLDPSEIDITPSVCDALFSLLAHEFYLLPSVASACTTTELELLRSLPIHKTMMGAHTSIEASSHCIVNPSAFFQPQNDWCLQYRDLESGGAYYKALGITELSDCEVLMRFCLPSFGGLTPEEQDRALSYVFSEWEVLQHDDSVVVALAGTKFVPCEGGSFDMLFQPGELLDPTIPLFRNVYKQKPSKFPARKFTSNVRWLEILRKSGLHCRVDGAALLDCAKEVEEMGRQSSKAVVDGPEKYGEVSEELFATAGLVVEAILANFASIYGSSFCQPLSEIVFVPAEIGLPIMTGNDGKRVLACYKELVLMKDWPLAWMCSPILKKASLVPPEFSWRSLNLASPPRFQAVLRHLQLVGEHNGEDILARWPSVEGIVAVEDAFLEIFNYLNKNWESLSSTDKALLQSSPFIPVANGTRLCPARRIFVHLETNLAPFAFQLPSSYLPFVKLLTDLGMQESPSFHSMQDLLLQMHSTCGYRRLNPNELCAVLKILDFLCASLAVADHEASSSTTIVPDDAGRLVHGQVCVYIDAPGHAMLNKIETSMLRFVHPQVPEEHCIRLGVRKLSEVVSETLDDAVSLEYTNYIGNISKAMIVQKLKSESFQLALWTLVHDLSLEMPNLRSWTKDEIETKLLWAAESLECVKQLRTRFLMVNGDMDITRRISSQGNPTSVFDNSVYEFVDKKHERVLLAEPCDASVPDVLSVMVSKVLESPACLPLAGLFTASIGSECHAMKVMRLRPHGHDSARALHKNFRGVFPGNEVSASDAALVQVHPLRPYYAGEIVAWCSEFAPNRLLRYGIMTEDVRAPAGQAVYNLQVETYPGEIQSLLSSNVFSFKTVTVEAPEITQNESSLPSASHHLHDENKQHLSQIKKLQGDGKPLSKTVAAAAVVGAVNDMMAAVGLPLGLDQQALLTRALTLQERLTAAQEALVSEQARAEAAAKEAEAARASWLCRVCLSSEVNGVLVPCGHVLCLSCSAAVTRCPFCRRGVSKSVHLYRP